MKKSIFIFFLYVNKLITIPNPYVYLFTLKSCLFVMLYSYLKKKKTAYVAMWFYNIRRFFKVGGPMNKILFLRNKRVFKGLVMLCSSFGGAKELFLQVGQAFDWLNFKMANDMCVYSFDSVHQRLKSKRRKQGIRGTRRSVLSIICSYDHAS